MHTTQDFKHCIQAQLCYTAPARWSQLIPPLPAWTQPIPLLLLTVHPGFRYNCDTTTACLRLVPAITQLKRLWVHSISCTVNKKSNFFVMWPFLTFIWSKDTPVTADCVLVFTSASDIYIYYTLPRCPSEPNATICPNPHGRGTLHAHGFMFMQENRCKSKISRRWKCRFQQRNDKKVGQGEVTAQEEGSPPPVSSISAYAALINELYSFL